MDSVYEIRLWALGLRFQASGLRIASHGMEDMRSDKKQFGFEVWERNTSRNVSSSRKNQRTAALVRSAPFYCETFP